METHGLCLLLQVFEVHFCDIVSSQVPQIELPLVLIDSCDRMDSLCVVMGEELHVACTADLHKVCAWESDGQLADTWGMRCNLLSSWSQSRYLRSQSMCPMFVTTIKNKSH